MVTKRKGTFTWVSHGKVLRKPCAGDEMLSSETFMPLKMVAHPSLCQGTFKKKCNGTEGGF